MPSRQKSVNEDSFTQSQREGKQADDRKQARYRTMFALEVHIRSTKFKLYKL